MGTTSFDTKPTAVDAEMVENTAGFDRADDNVSEEKNERVESVAPVYSAKGLLHYGRYKTLTICNMMN